MYKTLTRGAALEEKGEAGCGKFEWDLPMGPGGSTREKKEESGLTSGFWLSQQEDDGSREKADL